MAALDSAADWLAKLQTPERVDTLPEPSVAAQLDSKRKLGALIFKRRAGEVAIALQSFRLPVLQTLAIIDALLSSATTMHYKWQLLAAVKHFHVEPAVPIPEYHDRVDSQRVLELAGVVPKSGAVIKKQPLLEFAN